ncbi:MAG TPA: hypothetical protein VF981_05960 [Gemmatimonadaceae bacterium]
MKRVLAASQDSLRFPQVTRHGEVGMENTYDAHSARFLVNSRG